MTSDGIDFDRGRGQRHANYRSASEAFGRQCHALGVISGGAGHDSAGEGRGGQGRHGVVGSAYFERKDRLGIFSFQEDGVVEQL